MHTRYRDHARRGNSANSMHGVAVAPFVIRFVLPFVIPRVDALNEVVAFAPTFAFVYAGNPYPNIASSRAHTRSTIARDFAE